MMDFNEMNGVDPSGAIPESIVAECRNALSVMSERLSHNNFSLANVRRIVFAVRDGEILLACQTVLSGWFDGYNPIMTLRVQPRFPIAGQRLSLSVMPEDANASIPVYDEEP